MNTLIEVVRNTSDLERTIYKFCYLDFNKMLTLDSYAVETRATTRHKFKAEAKDRYERLSYRGGGMTRTHISLPLDVQAEVMSKFISTITVGL